MQVKIIKGTDQIGGCITEITSKKGTKIIIDYGYDLTDDSKKNAFPIAGLTTGKKAYDAVFITHSHEDHIGLVNEILTDIPVYVEEKSRKIYELTSTFTSNTLLERDLTPFSFEKEIIVNDDLVVIPYKTDHSAYNSAMFLVIDGEERVLHMGDYRSTGYSSECFKQNLQKIGAVDLLITEGTGITRTKSESMNEKELKDRAIELMKKYRQVFIVQSSSNIDRLQSFFEAAKATGKKIIFDISSANILKELNDEHLNYLNDEDSSVWVSNSYLDKRSRFLALKGETFDQRYVQPFRDCVKRCNAAMHDGFVMFVKSSMLSDIEHNLSKYRDNACIIYSMWPGYVDPQREGTEKMRNFIEKLKSFGITYEYLHTSGHADIPTMEYVDETLQKRMTIGIHTEDNDALESVFREYKRIDDGDIISIEKGKIEIMNSTDNSLEKDERSCSLRSLDMEFFEKNLYRIRNWIERLNTKENKDIFLGIRDRRLTLYYLGREVFTLNFEKNEIEIITRKRFSGQSEKSQKLNRAFDEAMSEIPLERNYGKECSTLDITSSLRDQRCRLTPKNDYSIVKIAEYLISKIKGLLRDYYDYKSDDELSDELPVQNLYLNAFGDGKDDLFIVEMEFVLPREFKEKIGKDLKGRYDMVGIFQNRLTFIELKVNRAACKDKTSGIKSHIEDMSDFLAEYNSNGLLKEEFRKTVQSMIEVRQKLKLISPEIDPTAIDFDEPDFWILLDLKDGRKISNIEDIEKITGPLEDKSFLKFYKGDVINKKYVQLKREH